MKRRIEAKLGARFSPLHLEVTNESSRHAVPPGSETHFLVVIASEVFTGTSRVDRHRMVHEALAEELQGPVHALTLRALGADEWRDDPARAAAISPPCLGGSKGDGRA